MSRRPVISVPRLDLERDGIRGTFEIELDGRAPFRAFARARSTGALIDLQTSDGHYGTTGDPELDRALARMVQDELVRARNAAVVAHLDRREARSRREPSRRRVA